MSNNLLIIFTRNPELGMVKTRLAKSIGDKNALIIYKLLLERTEKTIRDIDCNKAIYYSEKVRDIDIWNASIYKKFAQNGPDLGMRMHNAFQESFTKKYNKVIIIGTDLYDLNQNHIIEAFKALNKKDFVIGPAHDGGYYLLGMKSLNSQIFKNKKWGTSTVFNDTLKDLKNENVHLMETLNDIDVYDDLKNIDAFIKYLK